MTRDPTFLYHFLIKLKFKFVFKSLATSNFYSTLLLLNSTEAKDFW